ncbi:hypothetical protein [Massilibacterium senegalense]|uniref:hypothetical protein n=1 Tax=Massilibacterium senegalense TaxID=1632858 RepID=UPI0007812259|nr:hypothetical protein [Massilibacterium senegalense]
MQKQNGLIWGNAASCCDPTLPVDLVACTQNITAEVCSQANVTITPYVTNRTPIVSCVNGPAINTECDTLSGFTPLPNNGACSLLLKFFVLLST